GPAAPLLRPLSQREFGLPSLCATIFLLFWSAVFSLNAQPFACHAPTRTLPHSRPVGCSLFRRRPVRLLARLRWPRLRGNAHRFLFLLRRDASVRRSRRPRIPLCSPWRRRGLSTWRHRATCIADLRRWNKHFRVPAHRSLRRDRFYSARSRRLRGTPAARRLAGLPHPRGNLGHREILAVALALALRRPPALRTP